MAVLGHAREAELEHLWQGVEDDRSLKVVKSIPKDGVPAARSAQRPVQDRPHDEKCLAASAPAIEQNMLCRTAEQPICRNLAVGQRKKCNRPPMLHSASK